MSPTTTQPDSQAVALAPLVDAQAAAREQLTAQAVSVATSSARAFTGWYDSSQITAWATKLATLVERLQRTQAQSTDAYLARALSTTLGGRVRPVGGVDVTGLRAGITHAGAYGRAADVYRYQQSRFDSVAKKLAAADLNGAGLPEGVTPLDLSDPVEAAVQRVGAVADMDMQLADRAQAQTSLSGQANVTGYRRVIHPELSQGGVCGLCIAASTRIYHIDDLRAIHDRCKCTSLPIVGSIDPGNSLNNLDLQTIYDDAGGTGGRGLKVPRYAIDEHGELGPVLTDGTFRTPAQVKESTDRPRPKTDAQRRASVERILASELTAQDRAHDLAKADPKTWGRYAEQLDARITDLRHQLTA